MESSEQINAVVNNLSQKIGVAVEKIAPIAEKMVQETYVSYMFFGISWFILSIILFFSAFYLLHSIKDYDDRNGVHLVKSIISPIFAVFGLVGFCISLYQISCAFQPTVVLLQSLPR